MRFGLLFLAIQFGWWFAETPGFAAEPKPDFRLLELTVGQEKLQGRQLISDDQTCWLLQRDGQLVSVNLQSVTSFRQVANVYRPCSANEMRTRLLGEFGRKYEFDARGNHFLLAPSGKARACADVVEATSKSFVSYFSRRNLKLDKFETPMVTIIFGDHMSFLAYCNNDNITATKGLRGYYSPSKNRVALYLDQKIASVSRDVSPWQDSTLAISRISPATPASPAWRLSHFAAPSGDDFQDTLVHETTHQLGFNSGVHSRLGDDPTWVVEGLAMLFEGDANRDDTRQKTTVAQRMNRERFQWFMEYSKSRRRPKSLEGFLVSNSLFQDQILDAYSEAWALMFFLAETRSSQLPGYLRKLATRIELGEYVSAKRLSDFKESFGKDIPRLEVEYLHFMQDLESSLPQPEVTANDPFAGQP